MNWRVLVIEDNDTDYLLMQRHVHKVWPAAELMRSTNRHELEAALMQSWDLIVSDFHLPDIQAAELIRAIAEKQPVVPCLITSGSIDELNSLALPENVIGRVEKGDYDRLYKIFHELATVRDDG